MRRLSINRRLRRAQTAHTKRRQRQIRQSALHALTAATLALNGLIGTASADSAEGRWRVQYDSSFYSERDLDDAKGLPGGETERYEVKMQQFHLAGPLLENVDLGVDVTYETMSGASPWYVVPGAGGVPVQVMSGASIEDQRTDVLVSSSRYFDSGRIGGSAGYSTENDYKAFNLGLNAEKHFNQKNTTLSGGFGVSFDKIEPTDAGPTFPTRPNDEDKRSYTLFGGVSQLLGRNTSIQSNFNYKYNDGYLSDPYKQVYVAGLILADARPDERNQFSSVTQLRQHVPWLNGTLHADYRFYSDDWDMISHTFDLSYHQTLWDLLRLAPRIRYYSQNSASFYESYYSAARTDGHYSSDYRLSAYGAWTFGLDAEWHFKTRWTGDRLWYAKLGWERYMSDSDYALVDVNVENPGLVGFHVFTVSLRMEF